MLHTADQQRAGAAGRVVDALAGLGVNQRGQQDRDFGRGVELTGLLARLLLQRRIGQDAYDQLRLEWQSKLNHKQQELEALQREASVYIDDLDAALMLLSKTPVLFERLAKRDQAKLLKMLLCQVVVNQDGTITKVELNSPFAYLTELAQVAADGQKNREYSAAFGDLESPAERLVFANRASMMELHALTEVPD